MTRTRRILLLCVISVLVLFGAAEMAIARNLAFATAYVAVVGTVVSSALGSYTSLDRHGKLTDRPGALRLLLLGDAKKPRSRAGWIVFRCLRAASLVTILAAFGLSLVLAMQSWVDGATSERKIHALEQQVYLLYQLPAVPPRVRDAYNAGAAARPTR